MLTLPWAAWQTIIASCHLCSTVFKIASFLSINYTSLIQLLPPRIFCRYSKTFKSKSNKSNVDQFGESMVIDWHFEVTNLVPVCLILYQVLDRLPYLDPGGGQESDFVPKHGPVRTAAYQRTRWELGEIRCLHCHGQHLPIAIHFQLCSRLPAFFPCTPLCLLNCYLYVFFANTTKHSNLTQRLSLVSGDSGIPFTVRFSFASWLVSRRYQGHCIPTFCKFREGGGWVSIWRRRALFLRSLR